MHNNFNNKVYVYSDNNDKILFTSRSISESYNYIKEKKIPYPRIVLEPGQDYMVHESIKINDVHNLTIEGKCIDSTIPILNGSIKIDKNRFKLVSIENQNKIRKKKQFVYQMDLSNDKFYSSIKKVGFTWYAKEEFKIFLDSIELKKSRWPRGRNVIMTNIITNGNNEDKDKNIKEYGGKFKINEIPPNWGDEDNIWVDGVRSALFSWSKNKVKSIEKNVIELVYNEVYGLLNNSNDSNFFFENIFSELHPNEYYIDYKSKKLYIALNEDLFKSNNDIHITKLDRQMIEINSSNVKIKNLILKNGKSHCILVNEKNFTIENCVIDNFYYGVYGNRTSLKLLINSCVMKNISWTGIRLQGENSRVTNCEIFNFGTFIRCYSSAIEIKGNNVQIDRNSIHNFPHSGILLKYSNAVIEQNLIYNGMKEFKDLGLIYSYTKNNFFGVADSIIRNNVFHTMIMTQNQVFGIYLDGFTSYVHVEGNIFYNFGSRSDYKGDLISCIYYNGGNCNIILKNLFIKCLHSIKKRPNESFNKNLNERLEYYKKTLPTLSKETKIRYNLDFDINNIKNEYLFNYKNIIKDNVQINDSTNDIKIISRKEFSIKSKSIVLRNHYCFYGNSDFIGASLCEILTSKFTKHKEKTPRTNKCSMICLANNINDDENKTIKKNDDENKTIKKNDDENKTIKKNDDENKKSLIYNKTYTIISIALFIILLSLITFSKKIRASRLS